MPREGLAAVPGAHEAGDSEVLREGEEEGAVSDHDRPLTATPSTTVRRVTQEQMDALRDARDNIADCLKAARRNLDELDDCLATVQAQVVSERTE